MRQQYDDVHAVQHATIQNLWIFAVQHEVFTKMIGVTLCGTEEVAPRQARYKIRVGSMDRLAISEAWDTGNMYGYVGSPSDRGYFLASIDIKMNSSTASQDVQYEPSAHTKETCDE